MINCERYFGPELRPYGQLSKPQELRSPEHLAFVHSRQCVATKALCEDAHHLNSKKLGRNDYLAIPLTHTMHMRLHAQGPVRFEEDQRIDLKDAVIAVLIERIMELEGRLET